MQSEWLRPFSWADGSTWMRMALVGGISLGMPTVVTAQAVDGTWTGSGAQWTTGSNWSSSPQVPDNVATFMNNGAATAVTISNNASIATMQFNIAAPAYSFTVDNGATFAVNTSIVNNSTFMPSFRVDSGATLAFGDGTDIAIGSLADGQSGGGTLVIGPTDPGVFLTIAGGTSTIFSGSIAGAGSLELANTGTTLTLTGASNGGNIGTIGGDLVLCDCFAGGLTISGGSLAVAGFGMGVAVSGGTLSVINGGTLQNGGDLLVESAMVVSGPGSTVTTSGFTGVGIFGTAGTLTISDGGALTSQGGAEIDSFFGTANAIVTGPGSTWTIGPGLFVGGGSTGGPGILSIANGGAVTVAGVVAIGDEGPGTSAAIVTGRGSALTATGPLVIGATGVAIGTLTVADGAVVNAADSTSIGESSTLNLGTGGLSGAILTPEIVNDGRIVANFTDTLALAATISGSGTLSKAGTGTLVLTGTNSYIGGTTVTGGLINFAAANNFGTGTITLNGGGLQWAAGNTTDISSRLAALGAGGGTFDTNGNNVTLAGTIGGAGGLTKAGTGMLTLSGANTYGGGTTVTGGLINFAAANNFGTGTITLNGGGLQWATGNTLDISSRLAALGAGGGTFDTNGNNVMLLTGGIGGAGGLTKAGAGTLTLGGTNTYSGGTTVSGGILQGTTSSLQGNILNNANVTFNQVGSGTYAGTMSGTGSLTKASAGTVILTGTNSYSGGTTVSGGVLQGNTSSLQGNILNNASVVFNQTGSGIYAGAMSGTGGMTLQGGGLLNLTGTSTYTGATTVNASTLVVNGSIASSVSLNNGGILGGSGSIGALAINGGTLAPGNSIGTLTINGSFVQNGGTYVVEANAQGQSDRVNVAGTATINGASVQLIAAPGSYANSTTYTILNATGGVNGTYTGVTSNFAFLTPSLAYDANNVFLTLALQSNAFSGFGGNTLNQRSVGYALDQSFANASGDFATVIGALASLSTAQAPAALNTISGQPWANFSTVNVQGAALFMNALGQQMALARGTGSGQRQALAQACEIESCDGPSPFSVWGSLLGGVGSVLGNGNAAMLTYNFGGAAAGVDYRFDPRFLVGIGTGYATGTQWVNSFQGTGWTNSVSVAAYGSFTQAGFYADALAGYAYANNQLQRQITIPGLSSRTANGSTGANAFLGQVETGYKLPVYAPAAATVTPFARLQISSTTQNAFSEGGANSLSLNVRQQTTNSLRTVFGADLAGVIGLGNQRQIDLGLRLGWMHEYAYTGRPITAAFAGAPSASFTVYGATPQRDSAVLGFSASTTVAAATQLYLRYDGEIASGTDNHTLNIGVRLSW